MTRTKILLCCLFSLLALPALAQKEGIHFSRGNWKNALAEAKQNGKLIFIHVYTEWGLPSKRMETEIFPLKEVGDKYNAHFINFKVDADGKEGRSLSNKFRLKRFPTYLYFNGDGDLVYKSNGQTSNPRRFNGLADTVLRHHQENKVELYAEARYEIRKQDKAFVKEYLTKLREFGIMDDTISSVQDHYFSLLKPMELKDTATVLFLLNMLTSVRSAVFEHFISRQPFYSSITKQFPLWMGNVVLNSFRRAIETDDDALFWDALVASKKLENPTMRYPFSVFMYTNQFYVKNKQVKRVIEKAPFFLDRVCEMSDDEIHRKDQQQFEELMEPYFSGEVDSSTARNFLLQREGWRTVYSAYVAQALITTADIFQQHTRNRTDLKRACRWAERGVELDKDNYKNYPVLARLYAKTGMKREAIIAMQTAITLAQEQGASPIWVALYKRALEDL